MNIRNKFILSIAEKVSSKSAEVRQKIIQKILADLDKTDILTPIDVFAYDEDIDWGRPEDDTEELFEKIKEMDKEQRIQALQKKYDGSFDEDKFVPSPFQSEQKKTTRFGRTELHEAVLANDVESVERLLKQGLNVDAVDNNGNDAFNLACLEERVEIIEIFKRHGVSR